MYFFTAFFEKLTDRDVMDFIASIQSYDYTALTKRLTPALRQILDYSGEGLQRRLFVESRVLEIASIGFAFWKPPMKPHKAHSRFVLSFRFNVCIY